MKTTIHKIVIGLLVVPLTISYHVTEVRAADTLRTLQPMQTAPTAKRTLATQPAQTAPTAPLVRTTSPTVQAVPARAVVSRAVPSRLAMLPGGSAIVTLSGNNLDLITSVQALLNDTAVTTVTASLGSPAATSRQLTLIAQDGAPAGNYQVRLVAGTQTINLPATVLSVAVNAPLVVHPSDPLSVKEKVLPLSPSLVKTGNVRIEGVQDTMRPSGGKETGVAGKPSENDLNNAVRGSTVYLKQQRSASGLKLSQPSPLAPPAPSSPGQFGDRSGLQASIQRTTRLRPPSVDSGNTSDDGGSGSGLKSASGAASSSADQEADGTDSGKTGAGESTTDKDGSTTGDSSSGSSSDVQAQKDPSYAQLTKDYGLPSSAARSGLTPAEAQAFAKQMQALGANDTLSSDSTWEDVAEHGTEGPVKNAVTNMFDLPSEALNAGLSPAEMVEFTGNMQLLGTEDWVESSSTWIDIKNKGTGSVLGDAVRDSFGIPSDVAPGADAQGLLEGVATIQKVGGSTDDKDLWNDIGNVRNGSMTPESFVDKWTGRGSQETGTGRTGGSGNTNDSDSPDADTSSSNTDVGLNRSTPDGTGVSNDPGGTFPGSDSNEGTATVSEDSGSNDSGSEGGNTTLEGSSTSESGGEGDGAGTLVVRIRGTDIEVTGPLNAGSEGAASGGSENSGDSDNPDSSFSDSDDTADSGDDSDDDSDDSDDDDDDSDDSDDDSGSDDSGSSDDESLPVDPDRFSGSGRSTANLLARVARQKEAETQPTDPDRGGGSSAAPVLRDPNFGVVDPVDDGSGIRTGSSGSGVPDDPQSGTGGPGPDPAGEDSGSSSGGGLHIPANGGIDPVTMAGGGSGSSTGSGGQGIDGFGAGTSLWECRRALIEDSRGGLWCYCPVPDDPVTGVPIRQWERMPDSIDTSAQSLMDAGSSKGTPGSSPSYCREYTEAEWSVVYLGYPLPDEPPSYLLN